MLQTLSPMTDTHILKASILNPVLLLSCSWTARRITLAEEHFFNRLWRAGNALSACFVFHTRQARCQTALSRQAPGQERRQPRGTEGCQGWFLTPNISGHQHMQPGPSKFQAGSKFLCSGFSAKMIKASLPSAHRTRVLLTKRQNFCLCTHQNLALGLDYLSLLLHSGSENSGLIKARQWMS